MLTCLLVKMEMNRSLLNLPIIIPPFASVEITPTHKI